MPRLCVKIKEEDNAAIVLKDIKAGEEVMDGVSASQDIPIRALKNLSKHPNFGGEMMVVGLAVKN